MGRYISDNELYHFGILGMQWGVRRFQNEDGSLTPEGRARYGYGELSKNTDFNDKRQLERATKAYNKAVNDYRSNIMNEAKRRLETQYKTKFNAKRGYDDNTNLNLRPREEVQRYLNDAQELCDAVQMKVQMEMLGDIPGYDMEAARKYVDDTLYRLTGEKPKKR